MVDIAYTKDGDIQLETGDVVYIGSTGQHQRDILIANKGCYKESPAVGVGILGYLQDTDPENLLRSIRKEFTKDGMKVKSVGTENGQIKVDAEYENSNS